MTHWIGDRIGGCAKTPWPSPCHFWSTHRQQNPQIRLKPCSPRFRPRICTEWRRYPRGKVERCAIWRLGWRGGVCLPDCRLGPQLSPPSYVYLRYLTNATTSQLIYRAPPRTSFWGGSQAGSKLLVGNPLPPSSRALERSF